MKETTKENLLIASAGGLLTAVAYLTDTLAVSGLFWSFTTGALIASLAVLVGKIAAKAW